MEQRMRVTTPTVSSMAALMLPTMFHKYPSPAPDMVSSRLMKTVKRFPASSASALWATAVWGTKPASDRNTPLEFPLLWDGSAVQPLRTPGGRTWVGSLDSAFLPEAVKTARYGDN
jgi:hypothetical protein